LLEAKQGVDRALPKEMAKVQDSRLADGNTDWHFSESANVESLRF
jgi:hypothetical protein